MPILAAVVAFCLAAVQVSVMPYIKILGVSPDLVLLFAVCWAALRPHEAFLVVPAAGLFKDLATSDPAGMSVVALAPVLLLGAIMQLRLMDTDFVPTVILVALSSLAYGIISMTVLAATGRELPWMDAVARVLLPSVLVNAVFTPLVYVPVRFLSHGQKAGTVRTGRLTSPL